MTSDTPCLAPAPWRSEYPFASRTLVLDGLRMHYVDQGDGDPLLLVHGNPTWSFHWRRLILALADRQRLVAPDHIGCGLSDKPTSYPYCLATHVANLLRLIEALDLRQVTLVAQDWGGAIGLGAALAMPERFARLVLLNTGAFRSRHMPWRIAVCRWPVVGPLVVRGLNGFALAAQHMALAGGKRLGPVVRQGYLAPYDSWSHRVALWRFVADIPRRPGDPSYPTLLAIEQGLPRLAGLPCQLIWGMRDWCFTPEFLLRFQEFFPRAEVCEIGDAGHWVLEDAPEQVIATVRNFLARHPLPAAGGRTDSAPSGGPVTPAASLRND